MAKAPKTSTAKKTGAAKAADATDAKIVDAVVIDETPPDPPEPEPAVEAEPASEPAAASEPEPEAKTSEPEATGRDMPAPAKEPAGRSARAGFVGLLLGGVAAAAIGFVAARYVVPEGWPFPGVTPEPDPLELAIEAQGADLKDLSAAVDTLQAATLQAETQFGDLEAALGEGIDGLNATLSDAMSRLDAIETRLAAVEKLAPEGSAAAQMAAEAYERELAALREMFADELARVEAAQTDAAALEAQAAEAAQAAAGRAAFARITAALDAGGGFEEPLADLTAATGIAVPAALAEAAADGVPTLATLQDAFPAAAREALDAAVRAGVESGEVSRFSAFLQTQLGTRSLKPKEGDDADAVLSRAEAALRQGDIGGALAELDGLPDAAQPAMAVWRARATTRKAALDAGAALSQQLNAK